MSDDKVSLYEGLCTTRAIRRYEDEDVPEGVLNDILFAATRGPSGHNSQPLRFLVLRRTPETRRAREILQRAFQQVWAGERFEPEPDDDSRRARMARTMNDFVDDFAEVPVIVLALYLNRRRRTDLAMGASIYPACQNLLLAARAKGCGGVITQWHHAVTDELADELGFPPEDHVEIAATIPLGRPAGSHGPVRRLPLRDLVFEGRYGEPAEWAQDPPGTRYSGG